MSYNWQDASTPQGRERLKELMDSGITVVGRSIDGMHDDECYFIDPEYDIAGDESLEYLQFLDPSPSPSDDAPEGYHVVTFAKDQEVDENGLLPCPFCGGKASGIHIPFNFYTVECSACKFFIVERETPQLAIAAWNTRAGKEANP